MLPFLTRKLAILTGAASLMASLQAEPVTFSLETATLQDVSAAMQAGALSSVQLTQMYLRRIDAYDDAGPKLNAIAVLNPNALDEAAAADAIRASGQPAGPLLGVPFVVKHSYGVKDLALTGGSKSWLDLIPSSDSKIVDILRKAGGVFLGYANMSTFAISATTSTSGDAGTTTNAYVAGYAPGGSSGGSGVATGANLAFFAFGGETGGSIRNPSERSGVVGFKPSVGTVPISGILALVPNRDVIGPMTRYTADNAAIMDIVAQRDPNDIWYPITPILTTRPTPTGYTENINNSLAGKRIGVIRTYIGVANSTYSTGNSNIISRTTTTTEVTGIFNTARSTLQSLGATVVNVDLTPAVDSEATRPSGSPRRMFYMTVNDDDIYQDKGKAFAHRSLLEWVLTTPSDDEETLRAKVLTAARKNTNISSVIVKYIQNATDLGLSSEIGIEHFRATRDILKDFDAWMTTNNLDFLIWPTSGSKSSTSQSYAGNDLVNYLGLPLVTVPMGKLATGEPSTLAFSGRLYEDAKILGAAHAYEQASLKRISSPLAPSLVGESFTYDPAPVVARGAAAPPETVSEGIIQTQSPEIRPEIVAPSIIILGNSALRTVDGVTQLVFNGSALDGSGLKRLEVTVAGVKAPVVVKQNWEAVITDTARFKTFALQGKSTVDVMVLAEDTWGNSSAKRVKVTIPVEGLLQ